ncbi:FAD-dependent oxidoreductase [Actinopolymorpha alba]|uniref:FAD-dependent oxidoreductase n=1 Tax=Actinopolymorpha alba TaxID=533267 RepID=UPI00035C59F5|nr:FAD-dependent oxidoreductase [Actinopolymorpha alba]
MTHADPILVVGGGVIGLTTAVVLAESGFPVVVKTAEPPEHSTSAVAGALWGPWMVDPRDRVLPWAKQTLDILTDLAEEASTGVRIASGIEVSTTYHEPPEWARLLSDRRACRPDELPPGYCYGTFYSAPLLDMPEYLSYLTTRLKRAGGRLDIARITSLRAADNAQVIVNCTGIGARELVPDPDLYPVRGYHVAVTNPGLTNFIEADTGDDSEFIAIYPHRDHVLLGGTAEKDVWERDPDPGIAHRILARCRSIDPRLADAQVIGHRVGLRPTRQDIQLEAEELPVGWIIHNYGHGGAGVSLSWGCARTVADIVSILID